MRQTLKDRRKQLHRGMPMPRLLTMVLMLAIMALIFVRLRDPSTWRWFARDNDDDNAVVAENEPAGGKKPAKTHPAAADAFRRKGSHLQRRRAGNSGTNEKAADSGKAAAGPRAAPHPLPPVAGRARPRPRKTRRAR